MGQLDLSPLAVYESDLPKFRLGPAGDGGYVVCGAAGGYELLLSAGVGDSSGFEVDFLDMYDVPGVAFDHSVDGLPSRHPRLEFRRERADAEVWAPYLTGRRDVFMKVDIERDEWGLLEGLPLGNAKQIVIELHDFLDPARLASVGRLAETHVVLHAHANNCCGRQAVESASGEVLVPRMIELTLVRRAEAGSYRPNRSPIPGPLDAPNVPGVPEVALDGWPFVWAE